jgi:8-hydroxy-5-deazaflavin:NADPH oxidoreductase
LLDLGHQVKLGTRDTYKKEIVEWIDKHGKEGDKESENASIGSFAEAASFGEDLITLCTSWSGISNAIKMADPGNMTDKVVIDTTNPLDFSQGLPRMAVGVTDSAGEINQRLLPGAKVVKGFNIVGNPHMIHPDFPGGPPTMFICGNDEQAKKMVTKNVLTPFGWETIDIGGIEGARLLEPLAMLLDYSLFQNGYRRSCI